MWVRDYSRADMEEMAVQKPASGLCWKNVDSCLYLKLHPAYSREQGESGVVTQCHSEGANRDIGKLFKNTYFWHPNSLLYKILIYYTVSLCLIRGDYKSVFIPGFMQY